MANSERRHEIEYAAENAKGIIPWLEGTVLPVFEEVAARFRDQGRTANAGVKVDDGPEKAHARIVVDPHTAQEFDYAVWVDATGPIVRAAYTYGGSGKKTHSWTTGINSAGLAATGKDDVRFWLGMKFREVTGQDLPD